MKKILHCLLCLILALTLTNPIMAKEKLKDDGAYHVVNVNEKGDNEIIETFDSYAQAKVAHTLLKSRYHNLGITYGTTFLTIEYGVIAFDRAKDCSLNVTFTNDANGEDGYTNGCYGVDAAFLENNVNAGKVKFALSGVIGWIDGEQVTLYPIEQVKKSNAYSIQNGYLYHHIANDLFANSYNTDVKLFKAPSYMKEDTLYYSYDGHYFYEDFRAMIQDYRSQSHTSSINAQDPFYQYYQYISQRSTSKYDEAQLASYFEDELAINDTITSFYDKDNHIHDILTQSLLPSAIPAFLQYQNMYGANALLSLSLSMNESALGKSTLAFSRNNVFGHAAYDSDVEKNASRYQSTSVSVYAHDLHYISNAYANPEAFQWNGGFLGDKNAGMNVKYASDPYWGEKAAQYAFEIDEALKGLDQDQYCLGITNQKEIMVYQEASTKSTGIYRVKKGSVFSFILLERIENKEGTFYRVQSDPALDHKKSMNSDGTYSFVDSYGYIKADTIETIIHPDQLKAKNYIPITFEAAGGKFYPNQDSITIQIENGMLPSIVAPTKEHALFKGWNQELTKATKPVTYTAEYDEVIEILLSNKPMSEYAYGDMLDVKDGELTIVYADKEKETIPLQSDMISGYDAKKEGKQTLTITYAGCTTTYEIEVSKAKQEQLASLSATADELIRNYYGKTELSKESIDQLTQFKERIKGTIVNAFSSNQIRALDTIFQENVSPLSIIIKDAHYDLSVSGLSLAIQDQSIWNAIFPKTIVLQVKDAISKQEKELVQKVVNANHTRLEDTFSISGKDDFGGLQANSELLFSIQKPEQNADRDYQIYYIEGQDVYQLPTTQSQHRIQFQTEKIGSFAIVSSSNSAQVEGKDIVENNTIKDNGINYIHRFIVLPISLLLIIGIIWISIHYYLKKKGLRIRIPKRKHKKHRKESI